MSATPDELDWLLAREKIKARLAQIARGEDRRDPDLIRAAYWPDAQTDFGVFKGDFDAYLAWVTPGSQAVVVTQHVLGQSHIELDGEDARVETQVISYHRIDFGAEHRDVCIGGRYLDRFQRRGDEWRLAERTMLHDWLQDFGVAVDWSQGLMGSQLSGGQFVGKAVGDHSVGFFARD